jgi:hypothetical protein
LPKVLALGSSSRLDRIELPTYEKGWLKENLMALTKFIKIAALVSMVFALPSMTCEDAVAQTQPQGMTVGSPPASAPMPAAPRPAKPKSAKAKRADCNAQAKEKGLKDGELKTFVSTCLKG